MRPRMKTRWWAAAMVLLSGAALAVEHPGIVPQNAACTSCHAAKVSGKSVHSVMVASCSVCHVTQTQGDMTTVSLSMPKAQICFSCHEKYASLQKHSPATKAPCLECHDAHSSSQRMLLRVASLSSMARSK